VFVETAVPGDTVLKYPVIEIEADCTISEWIRPYLCESHADVRASPRVTNSVHLSSTIEGCTLGVLPRRTDLFYVIM
jgi:hypothetical protein